MWILHRKCWLIGLFSALAYLAVIADAKATDKSYDDGEYIDAETLEAIDEAVNSASDDSFLPSIRPTDELWYPREGVKMKRRMTMKKRIDQQPSFELVKKRVNYAQMSQLIQTTLNHLLIALLVLPPFILLYIVIPLKLLLALKMNVLANAFAMGAMSGYMLKKKHNSEGGSTLQQLQSFIITSGFPFWFPMLLNSAGFLGGIGHNAAVNKIDTKEEEPVDVKVKEVEPSDVFSDNYNDPSEYSENVIDDNKGDDPPDILRRAVSRKRRLKSRR